MNTRHVLRLAASLLAIGACLPARAGPSKPVIAVFSESDALFSETVTLYADGSYQQAETEKKTSLYGSRPVYLPSEQSPYSVFGNINAKRSGTWHVLDKEGGQPIIFKTLAALPKDAVIEVKGAMPFGITGERQSPYQSHGTRTLPPGEFQPAPPAKNSLPVTRQTKAPVCKTRASLISSVREGGQSHFYRPGFPIRVFSNPGLLRCSCRPATPSHPPP